MGFKNLFADVSSNFLYRVVYVKGVEGEYTFTRDFPSQFDALAFVKKIYSNSDVPFIQICCVIKEDWYGVCDE